MISIAQIKQQIANASTTVVNNVVNFEKFSEFAKVNLGDIDGKPDAQTGLYTLTTKYMIKSFDFDLPQIIVQRMDQGRKKTFKKVIDFVAIAKDLNVGSLTVTDKNRIVADAFAALAEEAGKSSSSAENLGLRAEAAQQGARRENAAAYTRAGNMKVRLAKEAALGDMTAFDNQELVNIIVTERSKRVEARDATRVAMRERRDKETKERRENRKAEKRNRAKAPVQAHAQAPALPEHVDEGPLLGETAHAQVPAQAPAQVPAQALPEHVDEGPLLDETALLQRDDMEGVFKIGGMTLSPKSDSSSVGDATPSNSATKRYQNQTYQPTTKPTTILVLPPKQPVITGVLHQDNPAYMQK